MIKVEFVKLQASSYLPNGKLEPVSKRKTVIFYIQSSFNKISSMADLPFFYTLEGIPHCMDPWEIKAGPHDSALRTVGLLDPGWIENKTDKLFRC